MLKLNTIPAIKVINNIANLNTSHVKVKRRDSVRRIRHKKI